MQTPIKPDPRLVLGNPGVYSGFIADATGRYAIFGWLLADSDDIPTLAKQPRLRVFLTTTARYVLTQDDGDSRGFVCVPFTDANELWARYGGKPTRPEEDVVFAVLDPHGATLPLAETAGAPTDLVWETLLYASAERWPWIDPALRLF